MTDHELTRAEAKALATELYYCYCDLQDPGPGGRAREWDALWVDKILVFLETETAAHRAERDARDKEIIFITGQHNDMERERNHALARTEAIRVELKQVREQRDEYKRKYEEAQKTAHELTRGDVHAQLTALGIQGANEFSRRTAADLDAAYSTLLSERDALKARLMEESRQ